MGPQPYYSSVSSAVLVYGMLTIEEGASVKSGWQTLTPIKMSSLSAQVLIKDGCSITPVSGIAGETLKSESVDGGTLWTFVNAPPSEEEEPVVPSTDETYCGTIAVNDDGEYVVTPVENAVMIAIYNVGTNTIVVPPGVSYVFGVPVSQLKIKQGAYDITGAFTANEYESGSCFLSLDAEGVAKVGNETITVQPAFTASTDETKPLELVGDALSVGVKSIPGLTYSLVRGDTPSEAATGTVVTNETATGPRVRLTDAEKPADRAFYRIRVSVGNSDP